jgi:hypothetical protein
VVVFSVDCDTDDWSGVGRPHPGQRTRGHQEVDDMSDIERDSVEIAFEPASSVAHPSALFRFDIKAAELIADNTYADHANYHQHGIAQHLYRTETGKWVWYLETQWANDYDRYEAAMDSDGLRTTRPR